jgi:hypothetical protein
VILSERLILTTPFELINEFAYLGTSGLGDKVHALRKPDSRRSFCGREVVPVAVHDARREGCITCATLIFVGDYLDWDVEVAGTLKAQLALQASNVGYPM